MYNINQKNKFINAYAKTESVAEQIRYIFKSFKKYEVEWGLDLSLQTVEKLEPVVNEVSGIKVQSTRIIIRILKDYVRWCKAEGYEVSNAIFKVKINPLEKIRAQMVSSPLHLATKLELCFDDPKENTIDITYLAFCWMAFSGLKDTEAVKVTADEVDFKNLEIVHNGHTYEIYRQSLEILRKACTLTEFEYKHPKYSIAKKRAEGNAILRGIRSSEPNLATIKPLINKKLSEKTDDFEGEDTKVYKLSYNRIYLSGVFYRAYQRERAGLKFSFYPTVQREMDVQETRGGYSLSSTSSLDSVASTMEKNLKDNYENWKAAFPR